MSGLLSTIRKAEVDRIAQVLRGGGGLIVVGADMAEEAIATTQLALAGLPDDLDYAAVDLSRCVSTRDLSIQLARAVATLYVGNPVSLDLPEDQLPASTRVALGELAQHSGSAFLQAVRGDSVEALDPLDLAGRSVDLLVRKAASGNGVLLVLDSADELVTPPRKSRQRFDETDKFLWMMRGRLQHAVVTPTLVLTGGPATSDLIADKKAAFYGWGTDIALGRPFRPIFEEAVRRGLQQLELDLAPDAAAYISELCQGSVLTADRLLDVLPLADRGDEMTIDRAWHGLMGMSIAGLRQQVRGLAAVDRLALAAAVAVANEQPPYRMAESPYSSEVSKALAALRAAGFATSESKGHWRLTDPLLAAWLRHPRFVSHGSDPRS